MQQTAHGFFRCRERCICLSTQNFNLLETTVVVSTNRKTWFVNLLSLCPINDHFYKSRTFSKAGFYIQDSRTSHSIVSLLLVVRQASVLGRGKIEHGRILHFNPARFKRTRNNSPLKHNTIYTEIRFRQTVHVRIFFPYMVYIWQIQADFTFSERGNKPKLSQHREGSKLLLNQTTSQR